MWVRVKTLRSCWTLYDPMDRSLPGSSVHGILQARILKWVAVSFSRASSWLRDQTLCILHLLHWQVGSLPLAPLGKPPLKLIHLGSASFYSLTSIFPFSAPLSPWQPPFYFCFDQCNVLNSTYKWNQIVFVFLWFISLSMVPPSFIIVLKMAGFHFLWLIVHCVWVPYSWSPCQILVDIYAWVYFWVLNSVPLVYVAYFCASTILLWLV